MLLFIIDLLFSSRRQIQLVLAELSQDVFGLGRDTIFIVVKVIMIYYEVLCLLLLLRNLFLVDRQLVIVMQSTEAVIIQLVCRRRVIIGR